MLSDAKKWDHASSDEQLAWIVTEVEGTIGVAGGDGTWWKYSEDNLWSENREAILENMRPESCRPNKSDLQPGRYSLELGNYSVSDPFEAAKRVRAHWIAQGWTVSDVVPLGSTKTPIDYFRADREDGAMLSFNAGELHVSLQIQSSCSDNNMTN